MFVDMEGFLFVVCSLGSCVHCKDMNDPKLTCDQE